jgi:hypothetical protein
MGHSSKTALGMNGVLTAASILVGGFSSDEALAKGERPRGVSMRPEVSSHRLHSNAAHPEAGHVCRSDDGSTGGSGEPPPSPVACQGTAPASPRITDFSDAASGDPITFGAVPNISGGTFSYAAPGLDAPELALASSADGTSALHVTVKPGVPPDLASNYFGFGLYFDACVDASAYDSVQFTLNGDLGDCGIRFAPTSSENVSPSDDPRGACTLESCFPPSFPVTTSGTVSVRFADLLGGSPGIISPASLIGVQWQMGAPDGATCTADFSIDDVTFIDRAVPIAPDPSGRVEATSNPLGVEGQWHVYADSYADGRPPGACQAAGHTDDECSLASLPDSSVPGFPTWAAECAPPAVRRRCSRSMASSITSTCGASASA